MTVTAASRPGPAGAPPPRARHVSAFRLLAAAGGIAAATVAAHEVAAAALAASARAVLDRAGITHGSVAADPVSGRLVLSGLGWTGLDGTRISIGKVALNTGAALVTPAQASDALRFEALKVTTADGSWTIPRLDVVGAAMGRADVLAAFDASSKVPLAQRLAKLTAAAVVMPEVIATQTQAGTATAMQYRDVRLSDLKAGVVAQLVAAGGTFESRTGSPGGDMLRGTFGPVAATRIDMVQIARLYTEAAKAGEPIRPVYGTVAVETVAARGMDGAEVTIARMQARDFGARPGSQTWSEIAATLARNKEQDLSKMEPGERARFVTALTDLLGSFEFGQTEVLGMRIVTPKTRSADIARIAIEGAAMGRPASVRVEGFAVDGDEARVRIGAIVHTGWSMKPTLDGLRETYGTATPPQSGQNARNRNARRSGDVDPRKFIPQLGSLAIRDVEIEIPEKGKDGRTRMTLKAFEIETADQLAGVPTILKIAIDRLAMPIPSDSQESGFKDLLSLGYRNIDLSGAIEARWSESSSDVTIGQVTLDGAGMGSAVVRGVIGNVPRAMFTADSAALQVMMLGVTVKQAALAIEDRGLAEKVLAREATKQDKSPAQLRREIGSIAAIGIPAWLGNSPGAKTIANAVARFIATPGRLAIGARSRDPGGLGLMDFVSISGNPAALLDKVEITATAE